MQNVIILFTLFTFTFTTLSAPWVQAGFWDERKRAVNQLAKLPADTQPILQNFPSLQTKTLTRLTPSVSQLLKQAPQPTADRITQLMSALPYEYGTVRKITFPVLCDSSLPVVLHIQDVHMNHEAQKNIGRVVQKLADQNKVELVALEGAFDDIDLSVYQNFSRPKVLRKMADYLLRENKISGPIYTGLTLQQQGPIFTGIDDPRLYQANVNAYKQSVIQYPIAHARLSGLVKDLAVQKEQVFSQRLKDFDMKNESYHKGHLSLTRYVKFLVSESQQTTHPQHKSINAFLQALHIEDTLDFKQVEYQRTQLIQALVKKLSKDQITRLLHHSVSYRTGQIKHTDFYRYLRGLCQTNGVSLQDYQSMDQYVQYTILSDKIEAEEFFHAIKNLEHDMYAALAQTPREKELVAYSKHLRLTQKLIDFSLTPDEWTEYREEIREIDGLKKLSPFMDFYRYAQSRDTAIASRLMHQMEKQKASVGVLVAGGFHAPGISRQLQEAGVVTIHFTPKMTKVDKAQGSQYLSVFSQEKTPLEKLFQGERLFLAHPPTQGLFLSRPLLAAGTVAEEREKGKSTRAHLDRVYQRTLDELEQKIKIPRDVWFRLDVVSVETGRIDVKIISGEPDDYKTVCFIVSYDENLNIIDVQSTKAVSRFRRLVSAMRPLAKACMIVMKWAIIFYHKMHNLMSAPLNLSSSQRLATALLAMFMLFAVMPPFAQAQKASYEDVKEYVKSQDDDSKGNGNDVVVASTSNQELARFDNEYDELNKKLSIAMRNGNRVRYEEILRQIEDNRDSADFFGSIPYDPIALLDELFKALKKGDVKELQKIVQRIERDREIPNYISPFPDDIVELFNELLEALKEGDVEKCYEVLDDIGNSRVNTGRIPYVSKNFFKRLNELSESLSEGDEVNKCIELMAKRMGHRQDPGSAFAPNATDAGSEEEKQSRTRNRSVSIRVMRKIWSLEREKRIKQQGERVKRKKGAVELSKKTQESQNDIPIWVKIFIAVSSALSILHARNRIIKFKLENGRKINKHGMIPIVKNFVNGVYERVTGQEINSFVYATVWTPLIEGLLFSVLPMVVMGYGFDFPVMLPLHAMGAVAAGLMLFRIAFYYAHPAEMRGPPLRIIAFAPVLLIPLISAVFSFTPFGMSLAVMAGDILFHSYMNLRAEKDGQLSRIKNLYNESESSENHRQQMSALMLSHLMGPLQGYLDSLDGTGQAPGAQTISMVDLCEVVQEEIDHQGWQNAFTASDFIGGLQKGYIQQHGDDVLGQLKSAKQSGAVFELVVSDLKTLDSAYLIMEEFAKYVGPGILLLTNACEDFSVKKRMEEIRRNNRSLQIIVKTNQKELIKLMAQAKKQVVPVVDMAEMEKIQQVLMNDQEIIDALNNRTPVLHLHMPAGLLFNWEHLDKADSYVKKALTYILDALKCVQVENMKLNDADDMRRIIRQMA